MSLIFEALNYAGYANLIICFTNNYQQLLASNILDSLDFKGEDLKALTAAVFFYSVATESEISNADKETILSQIDTINKSLDSSYKLHLFNHTLHIYLRSLEAILTESPDLRQQYLSDARQHAQKIKNKYFMKQIDRIGF